MIVVMQAGCMAYSLAKNPEVRAMVKSQVDEKLGSATPTFASLKEMPYTFAVLKESLRCAHSPDLPQMPSF